jgi:predicted DNA-binding transcriptional regulator AlpA
MGEAEYAAIIERLDRLTSEVAKLSLEKGDDDTMLHIRDVAALTSLSQREIYRQIKLGKFPKSVRMVGTRRAWHKAEVKKWNRQRAKARS